MCEKMRTSSQLLCVVLAATCVTIWARQEESFIRVTDNDDGTSTRLMSNGEMIVTATLDKDNRLLECGVVKGSKTAVQELFKESILKTGNERTKYHLVTIDVARYGRRCRKFIRDTLRVETDKLSPVQEEVRMRLKLDRLYSNTLWCTRNSRQVSPQSSTLGEPANMDVCCRDLHKCNSTIPSYALKYDLLNHLPYTLPSCACAEHFYNCLKETETDGAAFGEMIFNINKLKCFELVQVGTCDKYDLWFSDCEKTGVKEVAVMKGCKAF